MLSFISPLAVGKRCVLPVPRSGTTSQRCHAHHQKVTLFPPRIPIECCSQEPSTKSSVSTKSDAPKSDSTTSEPKKKPPFEIRGFSLANVFLAAGAVITISSFSSYLSSSGTASATSLGFVYGVPILLVGCALKYAELQPVPVESDDDARRARASVATDTQRQIYADITRHRYGDEAHLSAAMTSLGLRPRGEACPVLERAAERQVDGQYELDLVFYSVATPYKVWEERQDRYDSFFGPGVSVSVRKIDAEKRLVGLTIRSKAKME